jgi:hypothetical protein
MPRISRVFLILVCLLIVMVPSSVSAVAYANPGTGFGFGGWVSFFIPCTCSAGLWIFFTPLFLSGSPTPIVGSLTYTPGVSDLYPLYSIAVPTSWELGDYVPGAQTCLTGVPPACVPLLAIGLMNRVGTSAPGFPP